MEPQNQTFEVELPDGTIVEGPTKEAALAGAKRQLAQQNLKSVGQRGAPPSRSSLATTNPSPPVTPFITGEDLKRVGINMAIGAAGLAGGEALAPIVAPILSQLPGLSGVTSSMLSGPLSSISMATIENLLKGNTNPVTIGTDALANEAVNKIISPVFKLPGALKNAYQEYTKPGSIVDKSLKSLDATYSQYTGSKLAKFIEDNFATSAKRAAVNTSENRANQLIDAQVSKIAQQPVTLDDYAFLAGTAKTKEAANYYASAKASTVKGNLAQSLAEDPINSVPIYKQIKGSTLNINGQPNTVTILDKTIQGPISLSNSLIGAKEIVDEITPNPSKDILVNIILDPKYNKLQQTAARLLNESNAQFDSKGNLISHEFVSFKNAWQWQKDIGNYTANAYESGIVNFNKSQLNQLYNSLGDDISSSLPNWKKSGQGALQVWNDSKATVKERQAAFFPASGLQLGKVVLNNEKNTRDAWNNIIDDNHSLSKVLVNPKMPEAIKAGVPVENPRKELSAFKLADLWDKSKITDEQGNTTFNTTKFFQQFNSPELSQSESTSLPSSKDLLFSKGTQEDIRRFATALGKIDPANPSRYLQLRIGTSGAIAFGAGIASSLAGNSLPTSGLIGGGIVGLALTGHGVAKALINKNTARLMVAMAENQPLGMPEKFAARMIGNALKGEVVNVIYGDNSQVEGKIDAQGKFVIPTK